MEGNQASQLQATSKSNQATKAIEAKKIKLHNNKRSQDTSNYAKRHLKQKKKSSFSFHINRNYVNQKVVSIIFNMAQLIFSTHNIFYLFAEFPWQNIILPVVPYTNCLAECHSTSNLPYFLTGRYPSYHSYSGCINQRENHFKVLSSLISLLTNLFILVSCICTLDAMIERAQSIIFIFHHLSYTKYKYTLISPFSSCHSYLEIMH